MKPEEIKDLRQRVGMTQEAFAQHLKVAVSSVSKWERGEVSPGPDKIALMRYLASDRTQRAIGSANILREVARHADLDAMQDGEGPSGYARELRRIADNMERDATKASQ